MPVLGESMKRCTKCSRYVVLRSFTKSKRSKDGYHSWCKECTRLDARRRSLQEPEKVREIARRSMRKKMREKRAILREMKRKPCMDCKGSFPPCCMQFDHRDPTQKIMAVSAMIGNTYSWEVVLAEIAKCDLVCANCHAIRTWGSEDDRSD